MLRSSSRPSPRTAFCRKNNRHLCELSTVLLRLHVLLATIASALQGALFTKTEGSSTHLTLVRLTGVRS